MPKKKKTRKQKISSDNRQKTNPVQTSSQELPTYSVAAIKREEPVSQPTPAVATNHAHISTIDYRYLSKDLLKTLTLTGSIIIAELVLLFVTKGM